MQRRELILSSFQRAAAEALGKREIRFREREKKKEEAQPSDRRHIISSNAGYFAVGFVAIFLHSV